MPNRFSNLYINYYYGSKIKLNDRWGEKNAICPYSKIYYVVGGECKITIADKNYHAVAGDFFLIPAGVKHSFFHTNENYIQKYWFHFDLYPNSTIFKTLGLNYRIHMSDRSIEQLFAELHEKQKSETLTDKLDVKSLAIKILSSYIAASHKGTKYRFFDPEEQISVVLAYINSNLEKHISNVELSELCYLHPNHFVRFFKKKTGSTPQKYMMEQRVQRAKRLIEQTDLKFTDIAARVGFCDAPHLSKVFKSFYGLSPQEYRKTITPRRNFE